MILGIDPGFASCGWAILNPPKGIQDAPPIFTGAGVIRTKRTTLKIPNYQDNVQRAQELYREMKARSTIGDSMLFAVEAESWTRMPSDKLVGIARGVIYGLAWETGAALEQYGPKEIKREFCGKASASKQELEASLLEAHPELCVLLDDLPKTQRAHAADAAACALHAYRKSNYVRLYLRGRQRVY